MKKTLLTLALALACVGGYAQTPVYQFDFDGDMNNSGTGTFTQWTTAGTGAVSYVPNRLGQANKAINIPNNLTFTNIGGYNAPDLPAGNSSRTLSFWVKFINDTDNKTYPIVGWGSSLPNMAFGFWRTGSQNSYYTWGAGNDYNIPQTNAQIQASNNGWVHIAMTHNGSTLVIYYNGVAQGDYGRGLDTYGPSFLVLNRLVNAAANGSGDAFQLDDLRIYNTALTPAEILALYNPSAGATPPLISGVYFGSATPSSASVHFSLNPGGAVTTTNIVVTQYGAGIGGVYPGPTVSGNNTQDLQVVVPGLTPGTCYLYHIEASNSAGNAAVSPDKMICTRGADFSKTPIYHFEFNGNTYDTKDQDVAFQNPNSGYTNGDTAIRLDNNPQALSLPFLPLGSEKRTVAVRLQFEPNVAQGDIFSYGSATDNQSFGYTQTSSTTGSHYFWGNNDIQFPNALNAGIWYDMVFVYDGMDTKIYRDGVQVGQGSMAPNTIGNMFRLGRTTTGLGGYFNGRIDDLRIYNDPLNSSDVADLHQALSTTIFSERALFSLYPNPSSGKVNIVLQDDLESVAVYSMQGQQVLFATSNQLDVSALSKGIYLVTVTNQKQQQSSAKLVVK